MIKNITLSAESALIEAARKRARSQHKSLNTVFRDWLCRYSHGQTSKEKYEETMARLSYVDAGRYFSRDEMNER